MRHYLILTSAIGLAFAAPAAAQAPSWNPAQSAVWKVVEQSWADEVARNGRWPGNYVHDQMTSFDASFPMPRHRGSFEKWVRFNDSQRRTLHYEIAPAAITIVGDTAVVHYTGVTVAQQGQEKPDREMFGVSETLVRNGGAWKFLASSGWEIGDD